MTAALLALDSVVLTPHLGSAPTETREAMADATITALDVHFAHAAATGS